MKGKQSISGLVPAKVSHGQGCREGVCVVTQPRARVRADASKIAHQVTWPGLHCFAARGWSGGLPKQVTPLSRWTESQTRVKTTSRKKKKVKRPGSRVTNLSWFASDFLSFKSESLTSQEPQQSRVVGHPTSIPLPTVSAICWRIIIVVGDTCELINCQTSCVRPALFSLCLRIASWYGFAVGYMEENWRFRRVKRLAHGW